MVGVGFVLFDSLAGLLVRYMPHGRRPVPGRQAFAARTCDKICDDGALKEARKRWHTAGLRDYETKWHRHETAGQTRLEA